MVNYVTQERQGDGAEKHSDGQSGNLVVAHDGRLPPPPRCEKLIRAFDQFGDQVGPAFVLAFPDRLAELGPVDPLAARHRLQVTR